MLTKKNKTLNYKNMYNQISWKKIIKANKDLYMAFEVDLKSKNTNT